jgi:hypothetical protein
MLLQRHRGIGRAEIAALLIVAAIAGGVYFYYHSQSTLAPPPVARQAPPPVEAPAPPPPPVVKAPPPTTAPAPVVVQAPPPPPPTPQCVIIEKNLRDAQAAVIQAQADYEASQKAAVDALHNSADYKNAVADLSAKQDARKAAVQQLAKDNASGADTDQDNANLTAAAQAIIDAKTKITQLETDAAANDTATAQKKQALATDIATVKDLQRQLNDYIASAVTTNSPSLNCAIDSVTVDTKNWMVAAKLTPDAQKDPGAGPDAAIAQIAGILDKTLYHAPFTWNFAKFTVYTTFQEKKVPEFAFVFLRSDVDEAKFNMSDGKHYDPDPIINLAHSIWVTRAASDIQGIPPQPPTVLPITSASGKPITRYLSTLLVGGYTRADGSCAPKTYIKESWQEEVHPASK